MLRNKRMVKPLDKLYILALLLGLCMLLFSCSTSRGLTPYGMKASDRNRDGKSTTYKHSHKCVKVKGKEHKIFRAK